MLQHIDIKSSVPVYEQIENSVRFAITSGDLKEDDQLPTVRELADLLGVNPNTIAKAYRDLVVMGLIDGRRGKGYFVKANLNGIRKEVRQGIVERLHEVISEAKSAGMTKGDIVKITNASFAYENGGPYGPVPKSVQALAKK